LDSGIAVKQRYMSIPATHDATPDRSRTTLAMVRRDLEGYSMILGGRVVSLTTEIDARFVQHAHSIGLGLADCFLE